MENKKEIVSKIGYYSFYAGVIIEVLLVLIDKSAYTNPMEGRIFQITFLLFLLKVCLTRYSLKEYAAIALFLGLGAVSYFVTGRNEIIRVVMFIAACKDIDMEKCLKLVFFLTLAGCSVIVLFSLTGWYGTLALTQDYGRGSVETRYVLGMGHPNALQCMVWALTTLGLYLYGEKLKWYQYLIILFINVFFFLLTDSRTSLLVSVFVILLSFVMNCVKEQRILQLGAWLSMGAIGFSIIFSVLMAGNAYKVYDYAWSLDRGPAAAFWSRINDLLNGRIRILTGNTGFEGTISTWRLFSSPQSDYYFDLGWVRLFYWYGIIPACIFIAALLLMMGYCYRKKHYGALVMMVSFAVYSVMEAHAVSVYLARNYVFFLFGMYGSRLLDLKREKEERVEDVDEKTYHEII